MTQKPDAAAAKAMLRAIANLSVHDWRSSNVG